MMSQERRLLTSQQVAAMLQVDERTVQRYAREGLIKALRLGKGSRSRYRFDPVDVEAYITSQQQVFTSEQSEGDEYDG